MRHLLKIAATLVLASGLFAQPIPGEALGILPPGPGTPDLPAFLELTEAQIGEIRTIRQALATEVEPIAAFLVEQRIALETLLQGPNPDPTAAGELLIVLRSIAGEIVQLKANSRATAVAVLTIEQREKLNPLRLASVLAKAAAQAREINLIGAGDRPSGD